MMRLILLGLLYLCVWSSLAAQQCSPDPREPIFLEDFGSGPNPGPGLPQGTTGFMFGSTELGGYILSNTSGLKPRVWHSGIDHTEGDTDGYMLILNADTEEGLFYQQTISDLCPNTNYIFTYHLANLMEPTACIGDPVHPRVRIRISDANTENILIDSTARPVLVSSRLTWREFQFPFRTGPGQNSLRIRLTNAARPGCGNDLALDDISLRLCNLQLEQRFDLCEQAEGRVRVGNSIYTQAGVYSDALPIPNSCNDTLITTTITGERRVLPMLNYTFCLGDTLEVANRRFTNSLSFVDTLPGVDPNCPIYQPYEIVAQPPQNVSQNITLCQGDSLRVGSNWYRNAGTYVDSLTTPAGCDSIVLTTIQTVDIEVTLRQPMVTVELGESISLLGTVSSSNDFHLSWQPTAGLSCTDCPNPVLSPQASGSYQLLATDIPSGCQSSATLEVNVLSCEEVFVPNAFSPNFDRVNDQLEVFTEDCFTQLVSWRIFDRWGGQVYAVSDRPLSSNNFSGWDGFYQGQEAAQGAYSYLLILERNDGTLKAIEGEVILLR
jgi:gliding motility-associated-like protein